jgi:hypothetical protein
MERACVILARFLSDTDREGLLGDLAEAGASRYEVFRQVLFLLIRRQFLTLLLPLIVVFGAACNATNFAERRITYFFHGPSPGQHQASAASVLFWLFWFGLVAGHRLRMKSGPALVLNVAVLLCASTASVLIFNAGSEVPYSITLSLFLNGLLVWGGLAMGIFLRKRTPYETR